MSMTFWLLTLFGGLLAGLSFVWLGMGEYRDRPAAIKLALAIVAVTVVMGLFFDRIERQPKPAPTPIYVIVVTPTPDIKPQ